MTQLRWPKPAILTALSENNLQPKDSFDCLDLKVQPRSDLSSAAQLRGTCFRQERSEATAQRLFLWSLQAYGTDGRFVEVYEALRGNHSEMPLPRRDSAAIVTARTIKIWPICCMDWSDASRVCSWFMKNRFWIWPQPKTSNLCYKTRWPVSKLDFRAVGMMETTCFSKSDKLPLYSQLQLNRWDGLFNDTLFNSWIDIVFRYSFRSTVLSPVQGAESSVDDIMLHYICTHFPHCWCKSSSYEHL